MCLNAFDIAMIIIQGGLVSSQQLADPHKVVAGGPVAASPVIVQQFLEVGAETRENCNKSWWSTLSCYDRDSLVPLSGISVFVLFYWQGSLADWGRVVGSW